MEIWKSENVGNVRPPDFHISTFPNYDIPELCLIRSISSRTSRSAASRIVCRDWSVSRATTRAVTVSISSSVTTGAAGGAGAVADGDGVGAVAADGASPIFCSAASSAENASKSDGGTTRAGGGAGAAGWATGTGATAAGAGATGTGAGDGGPARSRPDAR